MGFISSKKSRREILMTIISTLHNLLKPTLPDLHATRLKALMAAVGAGLTGRVRVHYDTGTSDFRNCVYQT